VSYDCPALIHIRNFQLLPRQTIKDITCGDQLRLLYRGDSCRDLIIISVKDGGHCHPIPPGTKFVRATKQMVVSVAAGMRHATVSQVKACTSTFYDSFRIVSDNIWSQCLVMISHRICIIDRSTFRSGRLKRSRILMVKEWKVSLETHTVSLFLSCSLCIRRHLSKDPH
jgi:hypothetical protein